MRQIKRIELVADVIGSRCEVLSEVVRVAAMSVSNCG